MEHTTRTDEGAGRAGIEIDDQYRVLADEQRRALLRMFEQADPPATLDMLAVGVAAQTDAADATSVRITLHHKHLPLLDDVGALDYDADDRRVTECRVRLSELST